MLTRSDKVMHALSLALVAALILAVTGCQRPAPQVTDTRAADEAAIRAGCDGEVNAFVAADAAKLASFYTDDAVFMAPDTRVIQGRENIQKYFEPMLKEKPEGSLKLEKVEVAKSGDIAYEWATGKMGVKDKKGKVIETTFKSLSAWKKQADGSWKMTVDTLIPDPPPPKS